MTVMVHSVYWSVLVRNFSISVLDRMDNKLLKDHS
jgi:hypothetical protein